MSPTAIEWTEETWNPTVGCSRVSPGCDNCYAIGVAHRAMQPAHVGLTCKTEGGVDWTGEVRCLPERLDVPLRRRRPTRYFVDSMSDLFHPDVPDEFIGRVFFTMLQAEQHTFQVLTKRPQRMRAFVDAWLGEAWCQWIDNLWLGTSIESDRYAWRADHLRETPATVRFLSCEPLLGPLPSLDLEGIDWVIAGGESGPGARPCHPDWVRDLRERCIVAGLPFFFKQWGAWLPVRDVYPDDGPVDDDPLDAYDDRHVISLSRSGAVEWDCAANEGHGSGYQPAPDGRPWWLAKVGKKAAGRQLDGRTWDETPA